MFGGVKSMHVKVSFTKKLSLVVAETVRNTRMVPEL
jgi:hypothetical protein